MTRSKDIQCFCGEVQFTVINNFKTTNGTTLDVIICDSCGQFYKKPEDFEDCNKSCLE